MKIGLVIIQTLLFLSTAALAKQGGVSGGLGGIAALLKENQKVPDRPAAKISNYRIQNASESTYSIHELTQSGQTVREYVLPNGTIFAVTWRGMSQPDLNLLLGSYFDEFNTAVRHARNQSRLNQQKILSGHLVVERFGHMRDVRGKAYISKLMPSGLSPQELE